MASTISAGLTTTTALVYTADTSGVLQLQTNGTTTAVTIDTAQNVGIGVTPSAWITTNLTALELTNGTALWRQGSSPNTWLSTNIYFDGANFKYKAAVAASAYNQSSGQHVWYNAPSGTAGATYLTQAMTLDNSGNLLVGQTSQSQTTVGASIAQSGTFFTAMAASTSAVNTFQIYSTGAGAFRFYVDLGGTIHATSTSIAGISDATLKTNVKTLETGLDEINKLQPRRFDWINGDGTNVAGFIAQEVQTILPDLIQESLYSHDEQGNVITKLNLKMGDMIPTMVKAIQELSAQVTALQAKVGI